MEKKREGRRRRAEGGWRRRKTERQRPAGGTTPPVYTFLNRDGQLHTRPLATCTLEITKQDLRFPKETMFARRARDT